MSAFALVCPPEPELPPEPPKPSRKEIRRERRQALLPQADDVSIPMILDEAWKAQYRRRLMERDPTCIYCNRVVTGENATAEHAIPRAKGGWNSPANVWLACRSCNTLKGDRTPLEWLQQLWDACVKMGFIDDDDGEVEHAIAYAVGGWD